jgi:hypothetical protein
VAVKLEGLAPGTLHHIECRLWAMGMYHSKKFRKVSPYSVLFKTADLKLVFFCVFFGISFVLIYFLLKLELKI